MHRCLRWLGLFLGLLLVSRCHAQGRIDCNALQSHILGEAVHYCVMLPPGYDTAAAGHSPRRYPGLYFLHVLGDSEQPLFKGGGWALIQALRPKRKLSTFLHFTPPATPTINITS